MWLGQEGCGGGGSPPLATPLNPSQHFCGCGMLKTRGGRGWLGATHIITFLYLMHALIKLCKLSRTGPSHADLAVLTISPQQGSYLCVFCRLCRMQLVILV